MCPHCVCEGAVKGMCIFFITWMEAACFQFILRYWPGSNNDVHSMKTTAFFSFLPSFPSDRWKGSSPFFVL